MQADGESESRGLEMLVSGREEAYEIGVGVHIVQKRV